MKRGCLTEKNILGLKWSNVWQHHVANMVYFMSFLLKMNVFSRNAHFTLYSIHTKMIIKAANITISLILWSEIDGNGNWILKKSTGNLIFENRWNVGSRRSVILMTQEFSLAAWMTLNTCGLFEYTVSYSLYILIWT